MNPEVVWHELECGSYRADLPLWRELAERHGDPVLDLGCGSGRVALELAGSGHEVVAVDRDPTLLARLREQAGPDVSLRAVEADATALPGELGSFPVIIAPMQLLQLLDEGDRSALLGGVARHLDPRGTFAAALCDTGAADVGESVSLLAPDAATVGAERFESLPVGVHSLESAVAVERLRTHRRGDAVVAEERHADVLFDLPPEGLEAEAEAAGLVPRGRREIPATEDHVGSTVVLLGAAR